MDIEEFVRICIQRGFPKKTTVEKVVEQITLFKNFSRSHAERFAEIAYDEISNSMKIKNEEIKRITSFERCDVKMGEAGGGSRGSGDFLIHKKIGNLFSGGFVGVTDMDDAGVIKTELGYISVAVDGTHSRLSFFPFIAGFHVSRASMRDIYCMGAKPVALFVDMHLGDDADLASLYDFLSGVSVVSEVTYTPVVSGSTLRIGGDLVFGERICLLYTSPSPRDLSTARMPSSA